MRIDDKRLKSVQSTLEMLRPYTLPSIDGLRLDFQTFKTVVGENMVLLTKSFQNRMVIPAFEAFCDNITDIYKKCKKNTAGKVIRMG